MEDGATEWIIKKLLRYNEKKKRKKSWVYRNERVEGSDLRQQKTSRFLTIEHPNEGNS